MTSLSFVAPELRRFEQCPAEVIVAFRFASRGPLRGPLSLVDWRLHGHLSRLMVEGFTSGELDEALLLLLGGRLPQRALLVLGLGPQRPLDEQAYRHAVELGLRSALRLGCASAILSLPGRPESLVETVNALDWMLEAYDPFKERLELTVTEPLPAQRAMLPLVERWRLRQLVP